MKRTSKQIQPESTVIHTGHVAHIVPGLNQAGRTAARKAAGVPWPCPVETVPGDQAPAYEGQAHHYITRGGARIYHPSAYSKRGWSNMVYQASTLRVVVGIDWRPAA